MPSDIDFGLLTRRNFLAGSTAIGAGSMLPSQLYAQQRMRQRVARGATLDGYKAAIRKMLELPPSNPHNWYRQAIVHLVDCPHGNWWFLPWHRGYIYHFEQICGRHSGVDSFTLPFWDWTAEPRVPDLFFDDVLTPEHQAYEPNFNSFRSKFEQALQSYWAGLSEPARDDLARRDPPIRSLGDLLQVANGPVFPARGRTRVLTRERPSFAPRAADAVAIDSIRRALRPTQFEVFGSDPAAQHSEELGAGPLETVPHNNVHSAVAGFMGNFMSPVDPLFWLHHANIDRLWSLWTRRERAAGRTGRPEPADAWLKEPFRFFSDGNGQPLPNAKAADYIDEASLGYSYGPGSADDVVSRPVAVAAAPAPRQTFRSDVANLPLSTLREVSLSVTVPATTVAAARQPMIEPQFIARITLVPPSDASNYNVLVFANCPYLAADTPITDPHYVGCISFFGAGSGRHGHGHTYSLPLNATLERLEGVGRPVSPQIKLQMLTVDDTGQVKTLDGALTKVAIEQT